MIKKYFSKALFLLLISFMVIACEKEEQTFIPPPDFQKPDENYSNPKYTVYKNFPKGGEEVAKLENGVFESKKYGFRISVPTAYNFLFFDKLFQGGIQENPEAGGYAFALTKRFPDGKVLMVGKLTVNVNPDQLSLDDWIYWNLSPTGKKEIEVKGKNNLFIFDFEFTEEAKKQANFSELQKEVKENILTTVEFFDV